MSMNEALVSALAEIRNPPLDGTANYGRYATLPACLDVARRTLARHGLAVVQMTCTDPDRLVTRVLHTSGEFVEDGGVPLLCENKANPQKMGSAITYARRYGLCAILGIVGEEDDDGQRATPRAELPPARAAPAVTKPPPTTADDIPFDASDVQTDWAAWCAEQIAGFAKHRNVAEHKLWSSTVCEWRERLAREDAELHNYLAGKYVERRRELENKTGA